MQSFSWPSFLFSLPTAADEILLRSQELFSDVQDEFCDVKKILSRFEEWRGFYSDSYHSAYISLCLPKLLNPIIRHQLLAWNPLRVGRIHVVSTHWRHHFLCDAVFLVWMNVCVFLGHYWRPRRSPMVHGGRDFLSRPRPRGTWAHRQTDAVYYYRKECSSQNDR